MISDCKSACLNLWTISSPCSDCLDPVGEDLWMEINRKIPIETFCRIRCVCKQWRSLVSSPSFIKLQHSLTCSTTPPHLKPFLRVEDAWLCSFALYRPRQEIGADHIKHNLHFPFRSQGDHRFPNPFSFVGSICGVICISYSLRSSFDHTILWNPAIHKYVALPSLPSPLEVGLDVETAKHYIALGLPFHSIVIGFGYDNCKSEFKVVRIWMPPPYMAHITKSVSMICEIYSTGEGVWRKVAFDDINLGSFRFNLERENRTGCFVNGAVHWLLRASNSDRNLVLLFDCEREEFRTMEPPQEIYMKDEEVSQTRFPFTLISEYGGMLAVALHSGWGFNGEDWYVDMWVMEEHGEVSSWKKLYIVVDCHMSANYVVTVYQPSLEKMAPYGPNHWIKLREDGCFLRFRVVSDRVYEESMYLLDDHKAQSYKKQEIVSLSLQTRPEQMRPEQTQPNQSNPNFLLWKRLLACMSS